MSSLAHLCQILVLKKKQNSKEDGHFCHCCFTEIDSVWRSKKQEISETEFSIKKTWAQSPGSQTKLGKEF